MTENHPNNVNINHDGRKATMNLLTTTFSFCPSFEGLTEVCVCLQVRGWMAVVI